MRAIGIIAVVWFHNYQPPFLFFPSSYFIFGLFFFISGYFFKPLITIKDKLSYFIKKTRKLLLPYFVLNFFFGLFTMWLATMDIHLGSDLTLHNIFVMPFSGGDQFHLYLATWFLFNLYFINIFAGIVYQKNSAINISIAAGIVIAMLVFLNFGKNHNNSMWMIFFVRSAFGFGFFSLGYLLHLFEPRIQKFIIKPIAIIILYLIFDVLSTNFGNISYDILFGSVGNNLVIVPILASLCIILMLYIISFHVVKILKKKSIVYVIGQNSFAIMVWHLTFFFLVNLTLYKLRLIPYSALSDVFFRYKVEKLWLVYQIPGVFGPILLVGGYHFIKQLFSKGNIQNAIFIRYMT